jgi:hypothetical protein
VSNELVNPCIIEKPETEAVMEPRVIPARAAVERWPIEITDATNKEYSSSWALGSENEQGGSKGRRDGPKNR